MSAKSRGRLVGLLVLTQFVIGAAVNLVLTAPLFEEPGFLITAAPIGQQIAISVLLGVLVGIVGVVEAVLVWTVVRSKTPGHGLLLVVLSGVAFALGAVEQSKMMAMLSLSQAFVASGTADPRALEGLRGVVAAARDWAHFIALICSGVTLLAAWSFATP